MVNPNRKNTVQREIGARTDKTTNPEGGIAFVPGDRLKLYLQATTWLVGEPKFYKNSDTGIKELIRTVAAADPKFVLKLAVYCRNVLYLRTAPQVMLVECSLVEEAKPYVRKAASHVIQRPDEMATCVAYLTDMIGDIGDKAAKGSMPACLKKGLADAFSKFSEYQLQKYNTQRRAVKLKDVIRLVHPKPADEGMSAMYGRLVSDKMEIPKTWETIISADGSSTESWTRAVKVMPYMALMRNLRNLLENEVDLDSFIPKLTSEKLILKSKQFPYRFFAAYREVSRIEGFDVSLTLKSIEKAMEISVRNVPPLAGRTVIVADNSGSMQAPMSDKSKVERVDVANLSLTIASRICERHLTASFASEFKTFNLSPMNGMIGSMETVRALDVGYSTEGWKIMKYLLDKGHNVDRIIIFSDMVMYDKDHQQGWYAPEHSFYESLAEYRRKINPKVWVYLFDLSGYGTIQVPEGDPRTVMIGGFSDAIFRYFGICESERDKQLADVESIIDL